MKPTDNTPEFELDLEAVGNMPIYMPVRPVQERMIKDIHTLLAKGLSEKEAAEWVFGNIKQYEADTNFSLSNQREDTAD